MPLTLKISLGRRRELYFNINTLKNVSNSLPAANDTMEFSTKKFIKGLASSARPALSQYIVAIRSVKESITRTKNNIVRNLLDIGLKSPIGRLPTYQL